jgi:hypothetical protein
MPKKARSRKYTVRASLNVLELTRAGSSLYLQLYANQRKLGDLEIGRGSMYWTGARRQRSKRIPWSKFAEIMNELAYDG